MASWHPNTHTPDAGEALDAQRTRPVEGGSKMDGKTPGYHVTVKDGPRVVERKTFAWGTWQEIGFWLDEAGLNRPDYSVRVTFVDDPADAAPEGVA